MLSEQEILQLKKLRDFLTASFKGASVAGWKIDDVLPILNKIIENKDF